MSRLLRQALLATLIGSGVALGQAALTTGIDRILPDARGISSFNRPGTLTILSADGKVVQTIGPATREKLASTAVPPLLERAFVAAEDRRFYQHGGVDLPGIARALVRNLREGEVQEGASTITQQLARTVFLSQDQSLVRKLKEALLAGKLERQLSKKQILAEYLNVVYLGSSAYGVADAAWIYFSKTPEQLTLPEAALIAGLPPAPSVYSPLVNPDLALQRRQVVLRRMQQQGFISAAEREAAEATPLALRPAEPKYWQSQAPHFTSWVRQELPRVLSREQLEVGGLTVRSSLNLAWQRQAQEAVDSYSPGALEGALVAIEPGTGLVRAMVGGNDFSTSQFNRAVQAQRSPGSTFKLFLYLAALQQGMLPERAVRDVPRCYSGYCPRNSGGSSSGTTTIVRAVQKSLNTVPVALAYELGIDKVIAVARKLGIPGQLGRYLSLVLGSDDQTLLDMTAAYAAINNRGVYVSPTPFEEIYGPNGELLWSRRVDGDRGRRAVDSVIADAMIWMLEQAVRSGTGSGAALADRPVAGKTGTSEGGRDLWFIGSIPQLTTGVWLGYDNSRGTGSTSVVASYAWRRFMAAITRGMPVRQFPPRPELQGGYKPERRWGWQPPPEEDPRQAPTGDDLLPAPPVEAGNEAAGSTAPAPADQAGPQPAGEAAGPAAPAGGGSGADSQPPPPPAPLMAPAAP